MDISPLLHLAQQQGASDLHLVVDNPPVLRVNGFLEPAADMPPLTSDDMNRIFDQIASNEEREDFQHNLELDFGYSFPEFGRLRCNAAKQHGTISLIIRLLPPTIPTIDELNLPEVCKELVLRRRGLVIVSGPTGSGKSTTLAAMIDHLNNTETRRVVTVEDPIEYVYSNVKCVITQRQLGSDTLSFANALKHVLRQDPDVILVGEMRDSETAAAVLAIAETGHLILTTGHAPSAPQVIERVVAMFPPFEQRLAQERLASLLLGVLCQALVPKADGSGRIAAVEIMLANPAVRNTIREGKIYQLPNAIVTHTRSGMQLLDRALVNLYHEGAITSESLFAFCNDQAEAERLMTTSQQSQP